MKLTPLFLALACSACAASIPVVEHEAALTAQKQEYEARLFHADEDRRRVEKERDESRADAERAKAASEVRVEELEGALADKQRTLDDVTTQLVELQDAFGKLSSKERTKIEGETALERAQKAAVNTLRARFAEALKEEEAAGKVAIEAKDRAIIVRFEDGALFARGATKLAPAAKGAIERLAAAIKASEGSALRIEAHTDAVGARDSWALTGDEGAALVRALQKEGVDPSRLSYTSFGQYRPLVANDSEEGRAANRRVEIHVEVPLVLPRR